MSVNNQTDLLPYIVENLKKFSFYKFDPSLRNFEKLQVSNVKSTAAEAFGIDIESQFRQVLVNEALTGLVRKSFTKILNNGSRVDYILINDIALDYNFPPELIRHIYHYQFKNMVMSSKMGASIQDTAGYKPLVIGNTINTSGQMYRIGSFYNFEVWVDPYMKYNDHRIIFFDQINLNLGRCDSCEVVDNFSIATRNMISIDYQIGDTNAVTLYIIGSKDDPQYGEYLKITRDEKIDNIINT